MFKLAGKDVKVSRPSDLDKALIATTGCSSKEIDTILGAGPDRAAAALRPFMTEKDAFPGHDLARAIASDPEALGNIRALYTDAAAEKSAATAGADK